MEMKNKKLKGISISNDCAYEREKLSEKVPLSTPYAIDFAPTTKCNLKCIFCAHSSEHLDYKKIFGKTIESNLVKKGIDSIKTLSIVTTIVPKKISQ